MRDSLRSWPWPPTGRGPQDHVAQGARLSRSPRVPKTVAIEHGRPSKLRAAVERSRCRAQPSRELRPIITGSFARPVTSELAAFVDRILTDGTYVRAVAHLVADDPELADT